MLLDFDDVRRSYHVFDLLRALNALAVLVASHLELDVHLVALRRIRLKVVFGRVLDLLNDHQLREVFVFDVELPYIRVLSKRRVGCCVQPSVRRYSACTALFVVDTSVDNSDAATLGHDAKSLACCGL